jgi:hypothetical protein
VTQHDHIAQPHHPHAGAILFTAACTCQWRRAVRARIWHHSANMFDSILFRLRTHQDIARKRVQAA